MPCLRPSLFPSLFPRGIDFSVFISPVPGQTQIYTPLNNLLPQSNFLTQPFTRKHVTLLKRGPWGNDIRVSVSGSEKRRQRKVTRWSSSPSRCLPFKDGSSLWDVCAHNHTCTWLRRVQMEARSQPQTSSFSLPLHSSSSISPSRGL